MGLRNGRAGDRLEGVVVEILDRRATRPFITTSNIAADISTVCGRSCLVMTTGACSAASW